MKHLVAFFLVLSSCSMSAQNKPAKLLAGLGKYRHFIATKNAQTQQFFAE